MNTYKSSFEEKEEIPKSLTVVETNKLFKEYINYKIELSTTENKDALEKIILEIRNKIVLGNMELVYNIIKKRINYIYEIEDEEDIYQLAYETLIKFVDMYDLKQNNTFSNFLYHYLIGRVDESVEKTKQIYLPVHIRKKIKVIIKTKETLEQYYKKEVPIELIAEKLRWPYKKVCDILSIIELLNIKSYNEIIDTENFLSENEELIENKKYTIHESDIEKEIIRKDLIIIMKKILNELKPREAEVLKLHYGFYNDEKYTFEEIGEKLDLTLSRIHQIEKRALIKIRKHKMMKYLKSYKNI